MDPLTNGPDTALSRAAVEGLRAFIAAGPAAPPAPATPAASASVFIASVSSSPAPVSPPALVAAPAQATASARKSKSAFAHQDSARLERFLAELKLDELLSLFEDAGVSYAMLVQMDLPALDHNLDEIGVKKSADRVKITDALRKIKATQSLAAPLLTGCTEIASSDLQRHMQLASGSFGEVWLGLWRSQQRRVAIKLLKVQDLSAEVLESFKSELAFMHRLRSKFVVTLLGACFEPGNLCMVCELAENGSVFDVLHSKMPLSFALRLRMAFEAACGLSYLHQLNPPIFHRDIKSLNFLATADMRVLLTDFGLAKVRTETQTKTKIESKDVSTSSQKPVGSVRWMAPEVLDFKPFTAASDVFSFGVFLWGNHARCLHCANESSWQNISLARRPTLTSRTASLCVAWRTASAWK